MKKMILGLTALALAGAGVPTARAGDCGWSTAGKVLTGLFAGAVIARAFEPQPAYCAPAYAYPVAGPAVTYRWCPPPAPVVCVPARPVVVVQPPVVIERPVWHRPAVVVGPRVVLAPPVVGLRYGPGDRWDHHHPVCR